MKKLEQLVSTWIFKLVTPALFIIVMSLAGFIGNSLFADIKQVKSDVVKACEKTENALNNKIDDKDFTRLFDILLTGQKDTKEYQQESIKTMQQIQMKVNSNTTDIEHIEYKLNRLDKLNNSE